MKILKSIFFIVIQLVICSIVVETTCYFFLQNSSNPLYRARRILQYDSYLGWMQKPNLDSTFEHQSVITDLNGHRINSADTQNLPELITLGPSSAFGWGIKNDETYTSLSAKKMNLSVTNASGIGHSIAQGSRMWEKLKTTISPKYALIAYGVNDLDKFRFFDSDSINDQDFFKDAPRALKIDKLKLPSDFVVVLSLVIRQLSHTLKCDQLVKSPQRVEWNSYKDLLLSMLNEMKAKKITPILINTPFYLSHADPEFNEEKILKAYAEVSSLAIQNKCKEAHEKLKIAKALEPFSINQKVIEFNSKLKEFAQKNQIIIVDAHDLLGTQNAKDNFYDPVHPSVKGHKIIADEILKELNRTKP